jgi:hypothetical protein
MYRQIHTHLCIRHEVQTIKEGSLFVWFPGLAYQDKDIVFRFIIEYNSLRDFGP